MRQFLRSAALAFCLFLSVHPAWADAGIWRGSLDINLNGSVTNYRMGSGTGTVFSGADLGSINISSTLQLQDPYLFSYKNSGCDVTGADFYYRVYKMGGTPGVYVNVPFGFACNCGAGCWRNSVSGCGTNDQEWGSSATGIDLLAAARTADGSAGTYVLDVYWTINVTSCGIPPALGAYTATFTATTALPIELTAFRAEKIARTVGLAWTTASEHHNDRFEVERSPNGTDWTLLTVMPTQNGDARYPQTYSAADRRPWPGRNYYRLKQVDRDGAFRYSPVLSVEMDRLLTASVAPNPVEGDVLLLTLPPEDATAHVRLFDVQGRLLRLWSFEHETALTVPVDVSGIAPGILFLQVNGDTPLRVVRK